MTNNTAILSVDLEAYFQAEPMSRLIPPRFWPRFDLRMEESAGRALDLLDRTGAKATFFASGWLAETCPEIVAEIVRRGHDVGERSHLPLSTEAASLAAFLKDILQSRDAVERASGRVARGYRHGAGALPGDGLAHLEVLARVGFDFDSSQRPFGPAYLGRSEARRIHRVKGSGWSIAEVPLSSSTLLGIPYPVAGGVSMRLMPRSLFEAGLASRAKAGAYRHLHFHVWELDPEQPRVSAVGGSRRARQYKNLDDMEARLEAVLGTARFGSIEGSLALPAMAAAPVVAKTTDTAPAISTDDVRNVTIVVPCYNEEETLPYLAGNLTSLEASTAGRYRFSYVFVDDGSKDTTFAVLQRLFGGRPNCQVIKHPQNRGIAAATMTGIHAAKDEIVCGIDCDCSFDPHDLVKMIPLLTPGIDMVQASPYHKDGGVMNVPAWRLLLSRGCCEIYRRILNHKFSSYTACFRVYRRSAISKVTVEDGGFLGIMEMFVKLDQSGSKIVEFPAVLATRLLGVSKMKTLRVIRSHLRLMARTAMRPSMGPTPPSGGTAGQTVSAR